jgi:DNA invertase Pin-like site-specific DNA recombinase
VKIGYARVSTDDQTLDLQLDALKRVGCRNIYQEHGSGKTAARPQLEECLKAIRKGDTLLVWRLDRLGRNLADLIRVVTELENKQIGFASITEKIDTSSPSGRLVFHVFASLAEFERNLIRERTIAGLRAARARGRKGGRKPSLTAKDIKTVCALLKTKDLTVGEIAERFNVARSTIYNHI